METKTTSLEQVLNLLGYQGGTVHQVNKQLTERFGQKIDILDFNKEEFSRLILELAHGNFRRQLEG